MYLNHEATGTFRILLKTRDNRSLGNENIQTKFKLNLTKALLHYVFPQLNEDYCM